jgi:hypothetical protein
MRDTIPFNTKEEKLDYLDPRILLSPIHSFRDSPCWEWQKWLHNGYGRFEIGGKPQFVHRVMYEIHKGEIPGGLVIDHLCCNTKCCNPDHLEAVTQTENTRRFLASLDSYPLVEWQNSKTHCPHGHEYTEENTRICIDSAGRASRTCRRCHSIKESERSRQARILREELTGVSGSGYWQKLKTHCPKGHEYTEENTRYSKGSRFCRECGRQSNKNYYHARRKKDTDEQV